MISEALGSTMSEPPKEKVILVVDDMGTVRSVLAHHLRAAGYKAVEAESGAVALQILVHEPVDMVILDVMMPKLDGFSVLEKLKKNEKTSKIPIMMCTAKGFREDIVHAIQSGAADYIVKPFSKQTVLEKVKKLIGDPPSVPASAKKPAAKPAPKPPDAKAEGAKPEPKPAPPAPKEED